MSSHSKNHGVSEPEVVRCHILTISDSRTLAGDSSGRAIEEYLKGLGHLIEGRTLLSDDPEPLARHIQDLLQSKKMDVLITTGGTGITRRDSTFEMISQFLLKELSGFGEIFRSLSYEEMGAQAILSRATAGISKEGIVIFSLPGSKKAVSLALEKLIGPVLKHAVGLAQN